MPLSIFLSIADIAWYFHIVISAILMPLPLMLIFAFRQRFSFSSPAIDFPCRAFDAAFFRFSPPLSLIFSH
jgi:uncharacterized membrane protein